MPVAQLGQWPHVVRNGKFSTQIAPTSVCVRRRQGGARAREGRVGVPQHDSGTFC